MMEHMLTASPLSDQAAQSRLLLDLKTEKEEIYLGEPSRVAAATLAMLPNVQRVQDEYSTFQSKSIDEQRKLLLQQQQRFKEQVLQAQADSRLFVASEADTAGGDECVSESANTSVESKNEKNKDADDVHTISADTALRQLKRVSDFQHSTLKDLYEQCKAKTSIAIDKNKGLYENQVKLFIIDAQLNLNHQAKASITFRQRPLWQSSFLYRKISIFGKKHSRRRAPMTKASR
jgi:hypothetical protein